ncbi:TonB-dependent receptor [bacterium]|nr:TonB-dependent receptor [bacterium]RQV94352.1 MAG: TonB-dependent receptor [bacterium]
MKAILYTLSSLLFFLSTLHAQQTGSIQGRIVDEKTEKPLSNVNIVLQKTVLGTSTDRDGFYVIVSVPPGSYSLQISMLGYQTKTIPNIVFRSGETTDLNISLTDTPIPMDPIVVTAGKHPQSLSVSTQAIDMVPYTEIIHRQSRTIPEALQRISGVHFNESNISIRGSSGYNVINVGSRVLLMVDGIPVLTSDLGAINWDMLPLIEIDHIEVVKGAGSALYGSSVIGGVINIITRTPSPNGRFQLMATAGIYDQPHYEEWHWTNRTLHYERIDGSYSRQFGPLGIGIHFSRYRTTGYMENNEIDQWNGSGKWVWKISNSSRLDLYVGWNSTKMGWLIQWLSQNDPFEIAPFNKKDEAKFKTWNVYAQYYLALSDRLGLKLRISHLVSQMGSQFTTDDPNAFKPGQGTGWEIQADWIPAGFHHLTFGNEFRWDISGSKYFGDHKGYTISPYLQDEWALLPRLTLICGMRLDRHVLIDEKTETEISPKIGLNMQPFDQSILRMSIGKGFRAATVLERYMKADYSGIHVMPNPDLKPEKSWLFDLGWRQSISSRGLIEVSLFQTEYWDMIEPVINFLGTIQFQNYVRARIRGVEISTDMGFWQNHLELGTQITYMDPKDLARSETLPYRPKWSGNVTGTLSLGPLSFQIEYRYASRVEKVEIHPLDPRVPLKLLYLRGEFKWRNWTLQCAVNNALNYHYAQIERRMGEIRNFSLGVQMELGH